MTSEHTVPCCTVVASLRDDGGWRDDLRCFLQLLRQKDRVASPLFGHVADSPGASTMAMTYIDHADERVIIEADAAVDLSRGRRPDVFLGRARSLTASYVRPDTDVAPFLVSASTEDEALEKIADAVRSGQLVRKTPA